MMAMGFLFKDRGARWLFYLATFGWIMAAFYCFSVQGSLTSVIHFLGFFCILATFGSAFMPTILKDKPSPPAMQGPMSTEDYVEDMRRRRYGARPGYDKETGRNKESW
jgi:hypothetical protein